jgi:hypothetical protein
MPCNPICNPDIGRSNSSIVTIDDTTNVSSPDCTDMILLVKENGGGVLSTSKRVITVTSAPEVKRYFTAAGEVVRAANEYFANTNREIKKFYKIAYWDSANETITEALDAIAACDNCWFVLTSTHDIQEELQADNDMAFWATSNDKIYTWVSTDPTNENPANAASPKAVQAANNYSNSVMIYTKGQCEVVRDPINGAVQTEVVPVLDPITGDPVIDPITGDPLTEVVEVTETRVKYHNLLVGGYIAGRDLGQRDASYTLKFKPKNSVGWVGVQVESLPYGIVVAVTGENPDGTIVQNNNGYGNVFIKSMGFQGYTAGKTVTGEWIDALHTKLYLKRRIQYRTALLMSQSQSLPYDDARGKQRLASVYADEMSAAQRNGLFSNDEQVWGKKGIRRGLAWIVAAEDFIIQAADRQAMRLAPIFDICFVPANGVHFVPLTICVRLSTQTNAI